MSLDRNQKMSLDSKDMSLFKDLEIHDLNRRAINLVLKTLPGTVIRATDLLGQRAPFDILWGKTRICVRAARESTTSRFPKWSYMVGTLDKEKVDLYLLFALRRDEIFIIFILPPSIVPRTTITISEHLDFLRYEMFGATLETLPEKINSIEQDLPNLEKLYKEAKR